MNPTRDILADVEAARLIVGAWRTDKADKACRRLNSFRQLRFYRKLMEGLKEPDFVRLRTGTRTVSQWVDVRHPYDNLANMKRNAARTNE